MITREEMVEQLRAGVCNVKFTKVNGDTRDMTCTLLENRIPMEVRPKTDDQGVQATLSVVKVYDIKAEGWRSFKVDNVTSFSHAPT
jgi:hypothetical protein|tara:strand:+ start:1111 stop:1368 length:258 start_codon:yes stop_codon:yes gene_type:complete